MEIKIYFNDLKESMQKRILSAYNINSPEEMNFDTKPVTTIHINKEVLIENMVEFITSEILGTNEVRNWFTEVLDFSEEDLNYFGIKDRKDN